MSSSSHSKSTGIQEESNNESQQYSLINTETDSGVYSNQYRLESFRPAQGNLSVFVSDTTPNNDVTTRMVLHERKVEPNATNEQCEIEDLTLEERKADLLHFLRELQKDNVNLRRHIETCKEEIAHAEDLLRKRIERGQRFEQELQDKRTENACVKRDTEKEVELLDWFKSKMKLND